MLNTSLHFNNKSPSEEANIDNHIQLIPDDLQSSTKEGELSYLNRIERILFFFSRIELDLIKFVVSLQQQHSMKIAHMDQIHSQALKRLELQLVEHQNSIDRDSP